MRNVAHKYTMLLRPATQYGTLPPGVFIDWVEVPRELSRMFPHLKKSSRTYGVFTCNRNLTESELSSYQIKEIQ